jgi:pre-mRNA-splicing factor RBM22/SLT11
MTKAKFDKECKLCQRPFHVFRWRNGSGSAQTSYCQTQVCNTCAKLKNCCQACILDLEFGLPTHIRDAGLALNASADPLDTSKLPVNVANRDWYQQQAEREMAAGKGRWGRDGVERVVSTLSQLEPHYASTRAHVCAFFLRGQCDKGALCLYQHVNPADLLAAAAAAGIRVAGATGAAPPPDSAAPPPPPADAAVTTLYVSNVDPQRVTENDLRTKLDAYGALTSLRIVPRKRCAFAEYALRADAERAVANLYGRFDVAGVQLRVGWSLSSTTTTTAATSRGNDALAAPIGVAKKLPVAAAPPVGLAPVAYPSQSAAQLGFAKKAAALDQ